MWVAVVLCCPRGVIAVARPQWWCTPFASRSLPPVPRTPSRSNGGEEDVESIPVGSGVSACPSLMAVRIGLTDLDGFGGRSWSWRHVAAVACAPPPSAWRVVACHCSLRGNVGLEMTTPSGQRRQFSCLIAAPRRLNIHTDGGVDLRVVAALSVVAGVVTMALAMIVPAAAVIEGRRVVLAGGRNEGNRRASPSMGRGWAGG